VLASDYVPPALIEAAFLAAAEIGLPRSIAMVTAAPARMCRLEDRGRLAPGLRADLVRLREYEGHARHPRGMAPGAAGRLMRVAHLLGRRRLDDPLHAAGIAWLGRDCRAQCEGAAGPAGIAMNRDPRGYGCMRPEAARLGRPLPSRRDAEPSPATAPFDLPPLRSEPDGFLP
jgi:hypothetical protein